MGAKESKQSCINYEDAIKRGKCFNKKKTYVHNKEIDYKVTKKYTDNRTL